MAELEVAGLVELQRALRRASKEAPKRLKVLNVEIATEFAGWVVDKMSRAGGLPAKLARTGQPVKGKGQQRFALVGVGGARPKLFQAMAGLEWGAKRDRYRQQFGPWVGNQYTPTRTPGYFVGAELEDRGDELLDKWADGMLDLVLEDWPTRPKRRRVSSSSSPSFDIGAGGVTRNG